MKFSDPQVQSVVRNFKSPQWHERLEAFYAFIDLGLKTHHGSQSAPPDAVRAFLQADPSSRLAITLALTDLLERETDLMYSTAAPGTEEHSDYFADVIWAVTTLREPLSLKVILRCINTGGMATGALAAMGDDALRAVLDLLPKADKQTRLSVLQVLSSMAEPRNLDNLTKEGSRTALVGVLLESANSTDPDFRIIAARALAQFPASPEAVSTLNRLAAADPYIETKDGKPTYPVRQAAAAALKAHR